jgi:hypothetical protein
MNKQFFDKNKEECPCRTWDYEINRPSCRANNSLAKRERDGCYFDGCPLIFFFNLIEKWPKYKILYEKF